MNWMLGKKRRLKEKLSFSWVKTCMLYFKRKLFLWKQVAASKWPWSASFATTELDHSGLALVSLCVIAPRVCHTTKWLTPLVLKRMWHGPVKVKSESAEWNWNAWRTPENTLEFDCQLIFVWQAMITACTL